ncbi:MAG TPA: S8 family serine peptidase, partial [Anaerolineales bacterium]
DGNGYVDDVQGWNMVAGTANAQDDQGHGTHLAGIIGAAVNNSTGIAGIATNARILPIKALDNTGFGTYAQVAEAVVYATNMGARVINLGFGGAGSSELLQNAINYATDHGVLVVAAAGNSGTGVTYYPAGYSGVIAVGSVDNMLSWSTFSSFGDHISLVAPGVSVYSTIPGGSYGAMTGTSMSAAEVSGIAALLAGQNQFSDPAALRSALLSAAQDLGAPGRDPYFGYGVVHALDSLAYAGPILPTPTPWIVPTSTPGGPGGVTSMASTDMWAVNTQLFPPAPTFTHADDAGSIDGAFNDAAASITGPLGASATYRWTFDNLQDTTLTAVVKAQLDVRMYVGGYVDDGYRIEIRQGSFWQIVARMRPGTGFSPVPTSMTTLTFDVSSLINTPALANGAQVRISGDYVGANGVAESVTVYVDEVRLRVMDVIPSPTPTALFMPTSTLPARAITATPRANEPHNNFVSASTDLCSACHRSHGAQSFELRSAKGEENVCFACHTAGGSGTNVQPAFTAKVNTTTRFFKHNVFNTLNIHTSTESGGSVFGGANRHIECEDCHKPHDSSRLAASGSNAAPLTQQEMYNSAGVDPVWNAAGAPAGFNWVARADREYQVCFKCHSSYTTLPSYQPDGYGWDAGAAAPGYIADGLAKLDNSSGAQVPDSRDLAKEFNSYQVSFHPVAAQGRNQNMPAGSFVPGWSQDSVLYCSSCHENSEAPTNGNGPHGSQLLHLLTGSTDYVTRPDPTTACTINPDGCPFVQDPGELCFKCHQYGTYAGASNPVTTTDFRKPGQNLHSLHTMAACYTCHDTHGSEQQHLINFDTSVVTILPGYNSKTAWNWNGSHGTCYVACHGNTHGAISRFQYTR